MRVYTAGLMSPRMSSKPAATASMRESASTASVSAWLHCRVSDEAAESAAATGATGAATSSLMELEAPPFSEARRLEVFWRAACSAAAARSPAAALCAGQEARAAAPPADIRLGSVELSPRQYAENVETMREAMSSDLRLSATCTVVVAGASSAGDDGCRMQIRSTSALCASSPMERGCRVIPWPAGDSGSSGAHDVGPVRRDTRDRPTTSQVGGAHPVTQLADP